MKVRIRLETGGPLRHKRGKNRHLASACGALLIPAALMAYVLGFWRLAADMGLAGPFVIAGLFSHWQVWIAVAVALHIAASILNRYARAGEFQVPRALSLHIPPLRPRDESSPKRAGSRS